jgi:hypothetical protein
MQAIFHYDASPLSCLTTADESGVGSCTSSADASSGMLRSAQVCLVRSGQRHCADVSAPP